MAPATSAANSLAYGAGITDCKARVTCRFIVQALDKFGNGNNAGDTVTVTLDGSTVRTLALSCYLTGRVARRR